MRSKTVNVRLGPRSYRIIIGSRLLEDIGKFLKAIPVGRDMVVITNPTLYSIYKGILKRSLAREGLSCRFELIPDTERAKSEKVIANTIEDIAAYDRKRSLVVVAFGGGVVGDAAGFIASIYKRGVPYEQRPA